jgi:hypothetical protein
MPDLPDVTLADYQTGGRAAIIRATDDAIRTLSKEGIPKARIQEAARRIETACLTVLTEQDSMIQKFLALAAQPRTPEHAKLMQSRIGWHMEQADKAYMAIAVIEIQKTLDAYQQAFEPAGQVIEGTYREPWPPEWLATLLRVTNTITRGLVWFCAICVLTLLVVVANGSLVWLGLTLGLSLVVWLVSGRHWWSVVIPIVAIGVLVVFFL